MSVSALAKGGLRQRRVQGNAQEILNRDGVVQRLAENRDDLYIMSMPVQGFPLPSAWHMVHPAGKRLSPAAQAFKRHVFEDMASRAKS